MKAKMVVLFGVLAAALQGCAAGAGSCSISSTGASLSYCIEYSGSAYTVDSVKSACTAASGTYASGACATSGKACVFQKGTSTEYKWEFSTADGGTSPSTFCTTAGGTYE